MLYYNLNDRDEKVDFKTAAIKGQGNKKGLFFPEKVPVLPATFWKHFHQLSKAEMAFEVLRPYVQPSLTEQQLFNIVEETFNFDIPLVNVNENISSLELFHGPTLAFKDVGARFMSRCLGLFAQNRADKLTVLVATSGDTGGAVANGFYDVDGVEVIILYPSGKVSEVQEKQLTTLGKNIRAIEIKGTFDDCQALVKQAFADEELQQKLFLTSANSINVARWLPQQMYYFFAYQQWEDSVNPPVISVPSGNFGNICAGLLAQQSGLPVKHFIAACNINDVVPRYLRSGKYTPQPAQATLSNAMDVGIPSNFVRIEELFTQSLPLLQSNLSGATVTDKITIETIQKVYAAYDYMLDPHGAVAYKALEDYLKNHREEKGIFLETAHPVKFISTVEQALHKKIALPESLSILMKAQKKADLLDVSYDEFKSYILS
ncbi:threonine synthase [Gynurincola endophyticus]|uniref:threonine synthase n=1 Tax=Gynurincola endophyticus TaxID=2479004 RepID=UPI000F8DA10A|nr:threonine synthase [Gynurincola endophyticus]